MKGDRNFNYDDELYFFSSIRTTPGTKGKKITSPALRKSSEVKYILDCDYLEYYGFIEYMQKLTQNGMKS